VIAFVLALLGGGVASCTALKEYSRRVARNACRSAGSCTVYDDTGKHQEPCWPTPDGPMAYPGNPGWPFERGVCDTVSDEPSPAPGAAPTRNG
jgi:hypothetical protein